MGGILVGWWATARAPSFKSCPRMGASIGIAVPHQFIGVSSRAPAWGHPFAVDKDGLVNMFQVVPPHGGIGIAALGVVAHLGFKSCPRMGGILLLLQRF